ncbi:MAG: enoyl-CoA hydratase/isomerase family protein [Gammaproteobacteria bacterium]|nr:enoyl-CoA hydratase/isomerase family protein [Gammaproteobacteria bacterium]
MTDAVELSLHDNVALLTMKEPASRNALSDNMRAGLSNAANNIVGNSDIKALVITGSEGVFCAGGDLKAMLERHTTGMGASFEDLHERMQHLHQWMKIIRDLPIPVIVAVDGPAYGAGLGIALTGDIVLASNEASFSASFCKVGVIPDGNLLWSLPRIVGLQRARELFYTGRVVKATEALNLGLCMELHPADKLHERAMNMAQSMCNVSPLAFSLTKQLSSRSMELDSDALLTMEAQAQATCMTSDYYIEAITRFKNKEKPLFSFE